MRMLRSVLVALSLLGVGLPAMAQDWPTRPVKVISPFPPGGSTDATTRPFLDALSKTFGQQFVLENRAGAGGAIGAESVMKSPPDGYTFCACPSGSFTIIPHIRKLNYSRDDGVPVAQMGIYLAGLAVHPSLGVKTMAELVAKAKAEPGKIAFGSAGLGAVSHIRVEALMREANIQLLHVPYRGSADALIDLLAGNVQLMIENIVYPHVKAGKLNMLAMLAEQRHPDFPNVPTAKEVGFPGFNLPLWWGLFAPPGTPQAIVDKVNAAVVAAAKTEEMKQKQMSLGFAIATPSPAELKADVLKQDALYKKVITEAGIRNE